MTTATNTYQWRKGFRSNGVDPAVAAAEFSRLAAAGYVHPREIVEAAKDLFSPINQLFAWDDTVAAEKYRLYQARQALRAVEVIQVSIIDNSETALPAMERVSISIESQVIKNGVSTTKTKKVNAYVPEDALTEDESEQVFQKLLNQFESLLSRMSVQFGPERVKKAIRRIIK